jgi:hypothetical protein
MKIVWNQPKLPLTVTGFGYVSDQGGAERKAERKKGWHDLFGSAYHIAQMDIPRTTLIKQMKSIIRQENLSKEEMMAPKIPSR